MDHENSIIRFFQNLGYRYVYAPNLERDFRSPLYEEELQVAIHRLNPDMLMFVKQIYDNRG